MFKLPTLFILGAGFSFEADFPLGPALASDIVTKVRSTSSNGELQAHFMYRLRHQTPDNFTQADIKRAINDIAEGLPLSNSIDEFIQSRSNDDAIQFVSKLAI